MIGHSLGGAASLLAASHLPSVRAVVTLGTPSTTGLLHAHLTAIRQPISDGRWSIQVGGIEFTLDQNFWDDLQTHNVLATVAGLARPLLVLQPDDDETVPPAQADAIYSAARPPRSIVSLPGTGHLVSRHPDDADRVAGVISAWLTLHLPTE